MLCGAVAMSENLPCLLLVTDDRSLAEDWELVLLAQGLSPRLQRTPDGFALSVPQEELATAVASLSAYQRENPRQPAAHVEAMELSSRLVGATIGLTLMIFYSVTTQWLPSIPWFARGSAVASRIIQGELWRTVTALTLHVDVAHVLSNGIAAALFLSAVSSLVGPGLASFLVLLAGAVGNFANALLHGSAHVSVGASTGVFGAIGLLGTLGASRGRRTALRRRRDWLPAAAALALLGMLGTSGERVDIWAHLLGLLIGGVLGIFVAAVARRRPGWQIQWVCGTAAVATIICCWVVALR